MVVSIMYGLKVKFNIQRKTFAERRWEEKIARGVKNDNILVIDSENDIVCEILSLTTKSGEGE